MRFGFIATHRGIWPVSWISEALGGCRSGFHAWLNRSPSRRTQYDAVLFAGIQSSFAGSDRTYGARRGWHDVLAKGLDAGLHRIERLMRQEGLRVRPRRRGLPKDAGQRGLAQHPGPGVRGVSAEPEVDRRVRCAALRVTYVWTAQGWLRGGGGRPLLPPGGGLVDEFIDGRSTGDRCPDHGYLASRQTRACGAVDDEADETSYARQHHGHAHAELDCPSISVGEGKEVAEAGPCRLQEQPISDHQHQAEQQQVPGHEPFWHARAEPMGDLHP